MNNKTFFSFFLFTITLLTASFSEAASNQGEMGKFPNKRVLPSIPKKPDEVNQRVNEITKNMSRECTADIYELVYKITEEKRIEVLKMFKAFFLDRVSDRVCVSLLGNMNEGKWEWSRANQDDILKRVEEISSLGINVTGDGRINVIIAIGNTPLADRDDTMENTKLLLKSLNLTNIKGEDLGMIINAIHSAPLAQGKHQRKKIVENAHKLMLSNTSGQGCTNILWRIGKISTEEMDSVLKEGLRLVTSSMDEQARMLLIEKVNCINSLYRPALVDYALLRLERAEDDLKAKKRILRENCRPNCLSKLLEEGKQRLDKILINYPHFFEGKPELVGNLADFLTNPPVGLFNNEKIPLEISIFPWMPVEKEDAIANPL